MARRWQLAIWVLIGLALFVVVLWDSATMSTVTTAGGHSRAESVGDDPGGDGSDGPNELAFDEFDGGSSRQGSNNVLRPTTTAVPTTTSGGSASVPADAAPGHDQDEDGDDDGSSETPSTTEQVGTTRPGSPSSADPTASTTGVRPSQPIATTVFYQDFGAGEINVAEWEIYHSVGHAGWGLLRPSALAVVADDDATGGHALQITAQMGSGDTAGHLVSGGMKLRGRSQTYGRYRFRARVDPDQAEATSGAVLLWPADNDRPAGGEIDVFETWAHRATRSPVDSKLHWGEFGQDVVAGVSHRVGDDPVSGAEWHVYTLDWRKDHLSVSVDNGAPVTLSTNPDRIPQWPMELAIRLDGFDSPQRPGQQPIVSQPVTMLVDWIRIERFDS